ncbi:histidine phosphatase superfamily [Crepidotus variabilis]|uniref:Histidine phosphatase superfamily n=1 Tax=Crepidotus variabilis TaxID=179855 RepID=A0A9P6JKA2_9AGAR|nr:histidine phosphatase superfamily [Crepidotus variabilis]
MVTFYLIRHAESTDNVKGIWAGSRDAYLTQHAEALASFLTKIPLAAIYSSDLKRAALTAAEIKVKQTNVDVKHEQHTLLREQEFGSGEGKKFSKPIQGLTIAQHYAKGLFPAIYTRHQKFPGGECLDDVAERARSVIDDIFMRHLNEEAEDGISKTVVVVSHGIFLGELVNEILKRDPLASSGHETVKDSRGMQNTAWTKIEVKLTAAHINLLPTSSNSPSMAKVLPTLLSFLTKFETSNINRCPHLSRVKRQGGGLGSLPYDPDQKDIRNFFAGGDNGKQTTKKKAISKIAQARPKPYAR